MRNAEAVLDIIRERGKRGLPLEDVYRQLYNPGLYLKAYSRIYKNAGTMTRGTTNETVDGLSMKEFETLIEQIRYERYRWKPVRKTYMPKKNGKVRPLGIPTWTDKLLQEVIRTILEAYYEPQFSSQSHGFRPNRGCHTALAEIRQTWTGTRWFIEGDITGCFDHLDHQVMMDTLRENIHDNRLLRLIESLLQAGYLEEWTYHQMLSGSPQGGVISPILANIYLDKLDKYIERELLPVYNQGDKRPGNKIYEALKLEAYRAKRAGKREEAHELYKRMLPSVTEAPGYRRLRYMRYADDWILGFVGPQSEAEEIKRKIGAYLREQLHLELSQEKTKITHATDDHARFLGYEIAVPYQNDKGDENKRRSVNGGIELRMPPDVIEKKLPTYTKEGRATSRGYLLTADDYTIIDQYQLEYSGLVQYYKLAGNLWQMKKLHWYMENSLLKTLARKHRTTRMEMLRKYKTTVDTPNGRIRCLQITVEREGKKPLVRRFGGLSLKRDDRAKLVDLNPEIKRGHEGVEVIKRLLADKCELCADQRIKSRYITHENSQPSRKREERSNHYGSSE